MKKYILFSLILALAWSCTKTIEFDDKGIGDLIVLNSLIHPDSCISGSISKSTSILKGNRMGGMSGFIDGTVDLYENGSLLRQLKPLYGKFRAADIKPKAGNTYRMVVSSNGKQAEAETTIPEPGELISIDTATVTNEWGGKSLNCKIKIKDGSAEDYYRLVVTDESLNSSFNKFDSIKTRYYLNEQFYQVNSDDPVFKNLYNNFAGDVLDMGPGNEYGIFTDDYFQGKEYSFEIQVPAFQNPGYGDPRNPNLNYNNTQIYDRKTFHLQRLSKGMFSYMKYLKLYEYYHDDPVAEPVPVYSNVKNGAGIFGSYNDDAIFKIEKIYKPFSLDTMKVEKPQNYYGGNGGYGY